MSKNQLVTEREELNRQLGELVEKDSVKAYVLLKTRQALSSLKQSEVQIIKDSEDALSTSTLLMLIKISQGEIVFPADVKNKQGLLMELLKNYIKFYLLKRYARRSHAKPSAIYLKEKQESGSASRYNGGRFEKFQNEDEYGEIGSVNFDDEYELDAERIDAILKSKHLTENELLVIKARSFGYTFTEISEHLDEKADTLRIRFDRAMKKANLDKDAFGKVTKRTANKVNNIVKS
ncbi:hypothetical protein H5202_15880 [Shewanella sp. SG41-4]|uniref:hypothetical protein n=1 Tax=Shewanella sp. SG41-4 TaxID=2760976 RepID=UPI00160335BF|nr:hypothetical protein [Shewanella sp. SG41-4]MBB1440127.1 hypothetical protein [Shewanella sp. SG41-4]